MKKIPLLLLCVCCLFACSKAPETNTDVKQTEFEYDEAGYWIHPEKHTSPKDQALLEMRVKAVQQCQLQFTIDKKPISPEDCDARKLKIGEN